MQKIVLEPEEHAIDGHLLDDLIELYLSQSDADPYTLAGYRHSLKHFQNWWKKCAPDRKYALTPTALRTFARQLHDAGLSLETRKAVHRRVKQVFRWAYLTGRLSLDVGKWLAPAKGYKSPKAIPSDLAIFRKLFVAADETFDPLFSKTVLAILLGTGMRCAECATLEMADITFTEHGDGTVRISQAKKVRDREECVRVCAFDEATGRLLTKWIATLSPTERWLFPSPVKLGYPIDRRQILRVVKGCASRAGVDNLIRGPHDLRRAYATWIAKNFKGEQSADLLRRQLGHATFSMTSRYIFLNADDIRESLHSPLSRMKNLSD